MENTVYLAAPFDSDEKRENAERAREILNHNGFSVYCPWENKIPNAWDYPNTE